MSEKIQAMFSRISPTYDKANHALSFNRDIGWRRDSVRQLLEGGFQPRMALDLCAGTGDFALALKEKAPEARVILADFSKPMLAIAKDKAKGREGFQFLGADALKLPFPDMTFDAVVCGFGVRNLDSPEAGLREIARVLRPGGRAAILEFFKPTGLMARLAYAFYVGTLLPIRGGMISKDREAYEYLPKSAKNFPPAREFAALMERSGFRDLSVEGKTLGLAVSLVGTRK